MRLPGAVLGLLALGAVSADAAPINIWVLNGVDGIVVEDTDASFGAESADAEAYIDIVNMRILRTSELGPDTDGDLVEDEIDADPLDPGNSGYSVDLFFAHGYGDDGLDSWSGSGVVGMGPFFGSSSIWLDEADDYWAAAFGAGNECGETAASWYVGNTFDTDCNCGNPWMALAGEKGFVGGLFLTYDEDLASFIPHQFWVELSVDVADGALTLYRVGWDEAAYEPSFQDPELEPVPEPATVSIFALGTAGLFMLHKRRRR